MRKVILDCDTGHDDAAAITLALASESLDLLGVTTVMGNLPLWQTYRNTRDLITHYDVKQFYVGNQGNFDAMALRLLKEFEKPYSITYDVVLAYLPRKTDPFFETYYTILPEGIESVPPRFAIEYRNKWMIDHSDIVVTYVTHPFGGAAKFKEMAQKKKKTIIEIADYLYAAL